MGGEAAGLRKDAPASMRRVGVAPGERMPWACAAASISPVST